MADLKKPRLDQVASDIQLGKDGPIIKTNAGATDFRNSSDSGYSIVRGASPIADEDAVTKGWAETKYGLGKMPGSDVYVGAAAGTDYYYLPDAVAGKMITLTKSISEQMTNVLRVVPASGDTLSVYGSIVENPGYLQINSSNTVISFFAVDSTRWILISDIWSPNSQADLQGKEAFSLAGRDSWVSKTAATARSRGTSSSLNGYGYITCGTGTNSHHQYNDVANTWATKTVNPTTREGVGSFVIGGQLYVSCGATTGATEAYNDSLDSWTAKTADTTGRTGIAAWSINGLGFTVCGQVASPTTITSMYNDTTNLWTSRAASTLARYFTSGYALNDYGYTTCGLNSGGGNTNHHEQYNFFGNTWIQKTSNPNTRHGLAGFTINSKGYNVCGQGTANTEFNDVLNIWSTKAVNPTSRSYVGGNSLNGYGYITTGDSLTAHTQYN